MAKLLPYPKFRALDSNGAPLSGGKVYTYEAGTTTPKATYTDSGAGTPNTNPVILDSQGYADIWLSGSYKIVLKTSADVTIFTTDNVTADVTADIQSALNAVFATDGTAFTTPPTCSALATDGLAMGNGAVVASTGLRSVALGNSYVSGTDSFAAAIGNNTNTYGAQGTGNIVLANLGKASGNYGCVFGGRSNTVSTNSSGHQTSVGGRGNVVSGLGYAASVGGDTNTVSGQYAAVIGGGNNTASGQSSAIIAATSCTASGVGSRASGSSAVAAFYLESARSIYPFGAAGSAQISDLGFQGTTTNSTPKEIFIDGASERLTIPTDTTCLFKIYLCARRSDADNESAMYEFFGGIDNNAGTVALVGSVQPGTPIEDTAGWAAAVTADNTNKALILTVTGENSKTINWLASVHLIKITG